MKKLLSLFSGCGGMDIGFEGDFLVEKSFINTRTSKNFIEKEIDGKYLLKKTIFNTVFANDIEPSAKISWVNYFKKRGKDESIYFLESIVDLVKKHHNGNFIFPNKIDIITGGFPCQDFSVAGKRKGFNSSKNHLGKQTIDTPSVETRGMLYTWMKEVIEITKPNVFIAENVKGLVNFGQVRDIIQKDFSRIGKDGYYVFEPKVLHSGNYGVPQSRQRVFFIGLKKSALKKGVLEELEKKNPSEDLSPYPEITHKINDKILFVKNEEDLKRHTNLHEAFKNLLEPDKTKDLSQKYYYKAKFLGNHVQGQKEISLSKLGPTIRAEHHGNIEFRRLSSENGGKINKELDKGLKERRLTIRECARIQTFPDDFDFVIPAKEVKNKFILSQGAGYKLVGNAVPPLLAYHLANKIQRNWKKYFKEIS